MSGTCQSVELVSSPQQVWYQCITTGKKALGIGLAIAFTYSPRVVGDHDIPLQGKPATTT